MRLDERLRQATPVELDKPRKLLVTLNALYEIEEVTEIGRASCRERV